MTGVTIYVEGGGNSTNGKRVLRKGMDEFLAELKDAVRKRRWRWKTVFCGSRSQTYEKFRNARDHPRDEGEVVILLVDSEGPVRKAPAEHLRSRDGWNLTDVHRDHIHLMVQAMEAWILADTEALQRYYGPEFDPGALPRAADPERVAKDGMEGALKRATRRTTKGEYHKIRHAPELLTIIDPAKVRERCRHCATLFEALGRVVAQA